MLDRIYIGEKSTHTHTHKYIHSIYYLRPNTGHGLLIFEDPRSHITKHRSR